MFKLGDKVKIEIFPQLWDTATITGVRDWPGRKGSVILGLRFNDGMEVFRSPDNYNIRKA